MVATTTPSPSDPSLLAPQVLGDLAVSPTPYHAVERVAALLEEADFTRVDIQQPLEPGRGGRFAVVGGSLVAWRQDQHHRPFTIVGAHTDSPNLRVKAAPAVRSTGTEQLGVEVYGGVLLNSWLDRGLGLAGRVTIRTDNGVTTRLVCDNRPLLVIPQLAIHLDREIMAKGLKLNPQKHLVPVWALDIGSDAAEVSGVDLDPNAGRTVDRTLGGLPDDADLAEAVSDNSAHSGQRSSAGRLLSHLGQLLDTDPADILSWDLMAFDTQPPAVVGLDGDLFSSARIDNLLSCFCATRALASLEPSATDGVTPVLALYDHEEVGSESATGAAGTMLASVLERIAAAQGADRAEYLASLQSSLVISADGAHATHPNYADRHEPNHQVALNGGIVIKRNANHRYATDAVGEGRVVATLQDAGQPVQRYIHRNDLPCGSTIGPLTAARLGVTTVDLGAPQWAMHSIRETAGIADISHLAIGLAALWSAGVLGAL